MDFPNGSRARVTGTGGVADGLAEAVTRRRAGRDGLLETIRRWWIALPPEAKLKQANVNRLVEHAERIMQSESAGWLQEMQDAMAELRRQQEGTEAKYDQDDGAGPKRSPTGLDRPPPAAGSRPISRRRDPDEPSRTAPEGGSRPA